MKEVLYHQHGRSAIRLHVVADHGNGTFDLARDPKGPAIITGIAISEEEGDGCATPVDLPAKPKKGKASKPPKPEKADEAADSGAEQQPETGESGSAEEPPPEE